MIGPTDKAKEVSSLDELHGLKGPTRVISYGLFKEIKEGILYAKYYNNGGLFSCMSLGGAHLRGNFKEDDLVRIIFNYNPRTRFSVLEDCQHQTSTKFSELPQ